MRTTSSRDLTLALLAAASALACAPAPTPDDEIDINPSSLGQAALSIAHIERLQRANPADPRAAAAVLKLRPRLDELNHLITRVEPRPGHLISFSEPRPGLLTISESGPLDGERLLRDEDVNGLPVVALYRKLMGAEPPLALVDAARRQHEGLPPAGPAPEKAGALVSSSAEPSPSGGDQRITQAFTASDGPLFTNTVCFKGGDARACVPGASIGKVDAWTKTSFVKVAPFSGTTFVTLTYEGAVIDTEPVFSGNLGSFWAHSSKTWDCCSICACGTSHYDVRHHQWDVSGGQFHWTYELKWNCHDFDCESP
jgi:hypothetical protein